MFALEFGFGMFLVEKEMMRAGDSLFLQRFAGLISETKFPKREVFKVSGAANEILEEAPLEELLRSCGCTEDLMRSSGAPEELLRSC